MKILKPLPLPLKYWYSYLFFNRFSGYLHDISIVLETFCLFTLFQLVLGNTHTQFCSDMNILQSSPAEDDIASRCLALNSPVCHFVNLWNLSLAYNLPWNQSTFFLPILKFSFKKYIFMSILVSPILCQWYL